MLLGRDITERRRRAAADEAMQLLLGQAFRQAGIAMAVVDNSGVIVMSNFQFHKLCGRPASAIDGLAFTKLIYPDDIPAAIERRKRQIIDGQSYHAIVRLIGGRNEILTVQFLCNVLEHRNLRRLRIVSLTPVAASDEGAPKQSGPQPPARPVVLASGIRLIGLEEVRQTFGSRWPALAERVMTAADEVLRAHLQPGESFSRQSNGTGYVVCFAGSDVKASELRAAAITREIRARLLAENADANYTAMTLAVDPQPVSQADLAQPAATLSNLLEKRLHQRQFALEEQARACLTEAATGVKSVSLQATTPASIPLPLVLIDLPITTRRSLETAMLTLPEPEMRGFDPTRLRLTGLTEMAMKHGAADRAVKWIVPVDYDSMTLRFRRERCLEQLSALPTVLRQRLTPLLSQLPQSVYHARVDETLRVLKTFGRTVGIEVDNLDSLPFDPKSSSVALVVVSGTMLLNLLRRNRSAGAVTTLQRLRTESIRIVARDTVGLSTADLVGLGVDMIINEPQPS
ncbi:MAG: PAS domain-containing protein [Pseudomonadota bacterium]|nr:PAS domain-containing protein [Pseudomonadota bacterium]